MRFYKLFNQSICSLPVKLFSVLISCSLLFCCVGEHTKENFPPQNQVSISESAININTASVQELEKLPHVGEKIAQRIVERRERFGKFRRAEELLLIDDVSDSHFREMRNLVRVE